ncbi:hypothetical protein DVH24_014804 [Malus domestica]|uniref:Leucine-rich repeat-containing N-terminal plant-type domain-containing protein n=1 Tax=Malus domestica TaxID=3750 RepID=A0A498K6B7_MALDO|nr:hypothetical protein DVH24_014804 [Malus domestica]
MLSWTTISSVEYSLFSSHVSLIFRNVPSNLFAFDLSSNNLEGPVPVFVVLPSSKQLGLGSNKLRTFPDFLRIQTYLRKLDLSKNQVQGQVPNWIWGLSHLYNLNLSCNALVSLEGPLIKSTSPVNILDLHSNQLKGPILLFLPRAVYMDYSSAPMYHRTLVIKNLHGLIPASICNVNELIILDLSNNSLSGRIPQCLGAMSNLRRNNLTGTISNFEFLENSDLKPLELNRNQIQGQFPKSLANCSGEVPRVALTT